MNYLSLIDECNEYIKKNADEEISAARLAQECGYSLYHLSHIFRSCMGCSVGRYIMEEKMRLAAKKLKEGKTVSDVALEGGFDTFSGFTKAFRRHFGHSPREHKNRTDISSGPEFVKRTAIKAFGYIIPVDEDEHTVNKAAFWSDVDFANLPAYPEGASDYAEIGAWIDPDDRTGRLDYFFGYVTNDRSPAEGFSAISIPAGDYAVFSMSYRRGGTEEGKPDADNLKERIRELWSHAFEKWMQSCEDVRFNDSGICFEKYGRNDIQIFIPVIYKRNENN